MKKYKLLKDLPTVKAGTTFREITRKVDGSKVLKEYKSSNKVSILISEINDFDEWFEEIEPYWVPKKDDVYFCIDEYGAVVRERWSDFYHERWLYKSGRAYRSFEECKKARDRELTEAVLRRTSNFKPDFKNRDGGWIVTYDHSEERLEVEECSLYDSGEPVRYETEEDAQKSIDEHEKDWLAYFGVKEEVDG